MSIHRGTSSVFALIRRIPLKIAQSCAFVHWRAATSAQENMEQTCPHFSSGQFATACPIQGKVWEERTDIQNPISAHGTFGFSIQRSVRTSNRQTHSGVRAHLKNRAALSLNVCLPWCLGRLRGENLQAFNRQEILRAPRVTRNLTSTRMTR